MMYPLVIASIAVVAIFIERFNYYKKCRSDTQLITGMLREYIPGGKFDELADALAKDGGIPASVILDGVKCIHLKADQNELIEGASSRAVGELRKYLNYLDTIVTLSPWVFLEPLLAWSNLLMFFLLLKGSLLPLQVVSQKHWCAQERDCL